MKIIAKDGGLCLSNGNSKRVSYLPPILVVARVCFFAKSHSSCRQKLLSTSYSQHTSFFHVKSVNKSRSTRLFAAALVFGCAKVHVYRFARTIEEQQCF